MAKTAKELVAEADAARPRLTPLEAKAIFDQGNAVILDVRDAGEVVATGKLKDAHNISRGVLEFRADPTMSTHHPALDPEKDILVHCASGGRAALAAETLRQMGYAKAVNAGGFQELAIAGIPLDED